MMHWKIHVAKWNRRKQISVIKYADHIAIKKHMIAYNKRSGYFSFPGCNSESGNYPPARTTSSIVLAAMCMVSQHKLIQVKNMTYEFSITNRIQLVLQAMFFSPFANIDLIMMRVTLVWCPFAARRALTPLLGHGSNALLAPNSVQCAL